MRDLLVRATGFLRLQLRMGITAPASRQTGRSLRTWGRDAVPRQGGRRHTLTLTLLSSKPARLPFAACAHVAARRLAFHSQLIFGWEMQRISKLQSPSRHLHCQKLWPASATSTHACLSHQKITCKYSPCLRFALQFATMSRQWRLLWGYLKGPFALPLRIPHGFCGIMSWATDDGGIIGTPRKKEREGMDPGGGLAGIRCSCSRIRIKS
jgi:hypothetical protein